MDIPYHHLRTLLFCLLFMCAFWFSYGLIRPEAGSMLGATLAGAMAAAIIASVAYATLMLLYGMARMAWKLELKPYLRRRFEKPAPPYNWMQ